MIDNGDANAIKNDYLETLHSLIELIRNKALDKKIDAGNGISIYAGSSKVYQGIDREKPTKNSLTPEVVENIQKAITQPQNTKGVITIKVGSEEVFRVRNGKVINDKLGLSDSLVEKPVNTETVNQQPTSTETVNTQRVNTETVIQPTSTETVNTETANTQIANTESIIQPISSETVNTQSVNTESVNTQPTSIETVNTQPAQQNTIEELQKQVDELKNQVSEQEKIIAQLNQKPQTQSTLETLVKQIGSMSESLNKQQQVIEATQSTLNKFVPMKIENTKLQNWVGAVENKVKQTGNSLLETAKDKLKTVGNKINDSVRKVKGKMIETAVKTLLNKLGDRNADGSLSFTSNKFQFSQNGDTITVKAKDGTEVLKDGAIAPELPPAVEQEVKQLPEKVFKFMDQYDQNEKLNEQLQSKPTSLSR